MVKKTTAILTVIVAILAVTAVVAVAVLSSNSNSTNAKVIYWTPVPPVNQKAAIANGSISAGVSWEPFIDDSVIAGTGHVLIWSNQIWDSHPCCVLAVSSSFAQNNPDAVARVLRADMDANAWLLDAAAHPGTVNYTLLVKLGAQFSGRSTDVVNGSLLHTKYDTQVTNADMSWFVNFTKDFQSLNQYSVNITSKGYTGPADYVNQLVDQSYYAQALLVQPVDHIVANVSMGYLTGDLHQFARLVASNATVGGGVSLFEKYGVHVTSPNLAGYGAGPAEMDAFAAGSINVGYLGAPPVLLKVINSGVNVKIVGLVNSEGSAIVGSNSITNFSQLQGKIVGTPGPGSIQHLLFIYYAQQQGYVVKLAGT
ncbi:MAG TPA: ABC transporter substrate-binding protein [Methanomassiliicoccales archaeon]|jgi:ABC-type nitrate/sulfonate/bicarbonate transport system substrate-binding protein